MIDYSTLTLRNKGYIAEEAQRSIRNTTIMIAGCGMGSTIAETALRCGFVNQVLVDADTVAPHNLNRQCYEAEDIGESKTRSLARRLKAIYPKANIRTHDEWITPESAPRLVQDADLIIDTVDFVDLAGVTALHDAAHAQEKALISAVNAGFGAAVLYFPAGTEVTFRSLFDLPAEGPVDGIAHADKYADVIGKLSQVLDPAIAQEMGRALTVMEDGKPCPASQIAPGAACVGALTATIAIKVLTGQPVAAAPEMIIVDLMSLSQAGTINLAE